MSRVSPRTKRILTGSGIIVVIVVSAALIQVLSDVVRAAERTIELIALLPEGPQLQSGSPVWVAGHDVGAVRAVHFLPPGGRPDVRIAAHIVILERVREQVREDSEVSLARPQVLGPPVLDISPGSPGAPAVQSGDTLQPRRPDDLPDRVLDRLDALHSAVDGLTAVSDTLALAVRRWGVAAAPLHASFAEATAELRALSATLSEGPAAAFRDGGIPAGLERVSGHIAEIRARLGRLGMPPGSAAEFRVRLAGIRERAEAVRAELGVVDSLLSDPAAGTAGRLSEDPAMREALGRARAEADSLFAELRRAPYRLFF